MSDSLFALHVLQVRSRRLLKSLGLINPTQLKAKAFARLLARLLRLSDVEVVAVQGFAVWGAGRSTSECEVKVITTKPPMGVLEQEIKGLFSKINLSYDVNMIPLVADRETTSSSSDSPRITHSATEVRRKTAASTATPENTNNFRIARLRG